MVVETNQQIHLLESDLFFGFHVDSELLADVHFGEIGINRTYPFHISHPTKNIVVAEFRPTRDQLVPTSWLAYTRQQELMDGEKPRAMILRNMAQTAVTKLTLFQTPDQTAEQLQLEFPHVSVEYFPRGSQVKRYHWHPQAALIISLDANATIALTDYNGNFISREGNAVPQLVRSSDPLEIYDFVRAQIRYSTNGVANPGLADIATAFAHFRKKSPQLDKIFAEAGSRDQLLDLLPSEMAELLTRYFTIASPYASEQTAQADQMSTNFKYLIAALRFDPIAAVHSALPKDWVQFIQEVHRPFVTKDWADLMRIFATVSCMCCLNPQVAQQLGLIDNRPFSLNGIFDTNAPFIAGLAKLEALDKKAQLARLATFQKRREIQLRVYKVFSIIDTLGCTVAATGHALGMIGGYTAVTAGRVAVGALEGGVKATGRLRPGTNLLPSGSGNIIVQGTARPQLPTGKK